MPGATIDLLRTIPALVRFYGRYDRRWRQWCKEYGRYRGDRQANPVPLPRILQLIPTDACNLRCHMCNQWGDKSYFRSGKLTPRTMDPEDLLRFLDRYRRYETPFMVNMHGGEPFLWEGVPAYLDFAHKHRLDTLFTTNGTRLGPHVERLARCSENIVFSVSMDGGAATHDSIRGNGVAAQVLEGLTELRRACRAARTPTPKVMVNYCLAEKNTAVQDIDDVMEMARSMRAIIVNYSFRFFVTEEAGRRYDEVLQSEFGVKPTGAWTALVMDKLMEGPGLERVLDRIYARARLAFLKGPPFAVVLPNFISRGQASEYFRKYETAFGVDACFHPSYFVRISAAGELIYCPSFPDIMPGNVLRDDFRAVYENETSKRLRERVEHDLLPVCNRCCGIHNSFTIRKREYNVKQREPSVEQPSPEH